MDASPDFQTSQRAAIREERRRMVRSRRYLLAALAHPSSDWAEMLAFLGACIDHLRIAGARLIAQDRSLVDQLRPHLPPERADDHAYLDELVTRLSARERELADLAGAMTRLAAEGPAGLPAFSGAVDLFFDAPSQTSSRPMHSLPPLIEAYGSPDAWTKALVAADCWGAETQTFARIGQLAFPGLDAIVARAERDAPGRGRPGPA